MSNRKILSWMGDGSKIELSDAELRRDLENGTQDAAERGHIDPLSQDELEHIFDIYSSSSPPGHVESGKEVIFTYDTTCNEIQRNLLPIDRTQMLQLYEKTLGADTVELGHIDYSFKAIKPIVSYERCIMEQALLITTVPVLYGAMPNLGIYSQPDGPAPNSSELMSAGKIDEARTASEEAIEHAVEDMVFVASELYESGADGIDFDTTGAAGDPDFLATLRAVEILKRKYPDMCIEMGMSGEFILGMHGELHYDDTRLAGLFPHEQAKLAEKAGVTIFGPVVNTTTSDSCAWNVARVATFLKACVAHSNIPIHANMGMGVGGVPLNSIPPIDAVVRASKAVVDITRLDGL
jgi:dimethylamine--corrinoid protein Co-methyltransferase